MAWASPARESRGRKHDFDRGHLLAHISEAVKVISQPSGFLTTSGQTVSAVCPSDHPRVLGGGFTTTGTHIVVSGLKPIGNVAVVNGVTVDGYEVTTGYDDIGTSASWQVLAYASPSTAPIKA